MGRTVEASDIDLCQSGSASVTTSTSELLPTRLGRSRRTQVIIQNTSATVVTLFKGDDAAIANRGIRLSQNQQYIEADDAGYKCWQGAFQAIASAASTVVFVETTEK